MESAIPGDHQFADLLDKLTPRERRVLILRFGLTGGHPRTLEQVAKKFGATPERILMIEAKARDKLRLHQH